jgi:hypothetical protein
MRNPATHFQPLLLVLMRGNTWYDILVGAINTPMCSDDWNNVAVKREL